MACGICALCAEGCRPANAITRRASRDDIRALIASTWQRRYDRGAEQRQELRFRGVLVQVEGLREDPHLEMHTRGG